MSADFELTLTDNSGEVIRALESQMHTALEKVGHQAVSHAKQNITKAKRVDTGALRDSMNHHVWGETCYIGTNQSYAIYHEMGSGIYAEGGNGRKTPWAYEDKDGETHWTRGVKPIHFLKNAASEHTQEYLEIIKQTLKNG